MALLQFSRKAASIYVYERVEGRVDLESATEYIVLPPTPSLLEWPVSLTVVLGLSQSARSAMSTALHTHSPTHPHTAPAQSLMAVLVARVQVYIE